MGDPLSSVGCRVKTMELTFATGNKDGGSGGDAKGRADDVNAEVQSLHPT
jgi:hypothetical protein